MNQKLSKMEGRWSEKCSCFIIEVSRFLSQSVGRVKEGAHDGGPQHSAHVSPSKVSILNPSARFLWYVAHEAQGLVDSKMEAKLDASIWEDLKVDIDARGLKGLGRG